MKSRNTSKSVKPASSKSEKRTKKILATLIEHYQLGRKAKRACNRKKSPDSIAQFASKNGIDVRTARMRLAFAMQYNQADFEEFCELRRVIKSQANVVSEEENTLPLLSAHVTYLLTIEAAVVAWNKNNSPNELDARESRKAFAQRAADKNLTPKQLHDAIRKEFGRDRIEVHGRKHFIASKLKKAVGKYIDKGENWFTHGQLLVSKVISVPKLKKQKAVDELRRFLIAGEKRCKELRELLPEEYASEPSKSKRK